MKQKRGIRNNNPLNIRATGDRWLGLTGKDDDGFAVFESPATGIRAAAKILQAYAEKHGIKTLLEVVYRWAPPEENDSGAYLKAVEIWADLEADDQVDLYDYATVLAILKAMARMENGKPPKGTPPSWYDDKTWERGLRMAGLVPRKPLPSSRTMQGTATAGIGITAAIGALTDQFGVPEQIASLLPTLLAELTNSQASLLLMLISLGGALWAAWARADDYKQGRL